MNTEFEDDAAFQRKNGFAIANNKQARGLDEYRAASLLEEFDATLLPTPDALDLPGDCDVKGFILDNVTPFNGAPDFLAPPTDRTMRALDKFSDLLEAERVNGILGTCFESKRYFFVYFFLMI